MTIPAESVLLFELGGRTFSLPLCAVEEILPAVSLLPIPGALLAMEGLLEIRGRIVPVLNIAAMTEKLRPDVIVMDLIMPEMDGLAATEETMAATPTPIVIVSASNSIHETSTAMKALAAGALTIAAKPAVSVSDVGVMQEQFDFIRTSISTCLQDLAKI